jgi:very-short-patch-repair endonuclease
MPDVRQVRLAERDKIDARGLAKLAARQHGVVSASQLRAAGLTRSAISRWSAAGRLHRVHCRVYALGHRALSIQGRLHAALLYAGPGAALSHTTAAWAWQLIDPEPTRIHLTVPGRRRSLPELRVHHTRHLPSLHRHGFPVTSISRTLVDLGAMLSLRRLRRALAEADYRGLLDHEDLKAELANRRPGSKAVKTALHRHLPALAKTRSILEERFLELCESARLSRPRVNELVNGVMVDCLWRDQWVVVELDGGPAHGGAAAMKRDRERELALRRIGYAVVRYTWEQVTQRPEEVAADLRSLLSAQALLRVHVDRDRQVA